MNMDHLQVLRPRRADTDLITCSSCLRVRSGSGWIEAEQVIKELRSYELEAPPRLRPAVCEPCAESILNRRAEAAEAVAA
jgi:hypothetical protein